MPLESIFAIAEAPMPDEMPPPPICTIGVSVELLPFSEMPPKFGALTLIVGLRLVRAGLKLKIPVPALLITGDPTIVPPSNKLTVPIGLVLSKRSVPLVSEPVPATFNTPFDTPPTESVPPLVLSVPETVD